MQSLARMFAPAIGVDEDVINANSSGCLGAYILRLGNFPELTLRVQQGHHFRRLGTVQVTARRVDNRIETTIGGTAFGVMLHEIPLHSL